MMARAMTNVLTFFFLVSQVRHSFERLTVIREQHSYAKRELTCISEDDGAALVWNEKISKESMTTHFQNIEIQNSNTDNILFDCKMGKNDTCLELWNRENWDFTDSLETPMGPVFDRRWEDFQEYGNFDKEYDSVSLQNTTAFFFSVRAMSSDVQILLCNGINYTKDFCYWILIGGWGNSKSVIRRCSTGVPRPRMSTQDKKCQQNRASFQHSPLSSTEWRTFLVMWNMETRSISIYDSFNDTVFMRYEDTEQPESNMESQVVTSSDPFNYYHLFIRSADKMFYRFHIYSFLHTTLTDATLTSPSFSFNNTICIQLLLGLCATCEMYISLYDRRGITELENFLIKSSSKYSSHDLPTWQSVTIEYSTHSYNVAKMKLTPKLNSYSSNPLWAVANIRHCSTSFRKSTLHSALTSETWNEWPSVTCEKLFYDNHTVVNAVSNPVSDIALDNAECPEGKIGPQCLFSCTYDRYYGNNCKGYAICYVEGCTCPPGFTGSDCAIPCQTRKYGHDCKNHCGLCKMPNDYVSDICNKITGACSAGCIYNSKIVYVPPLCHVDIIRPDPPTIDVVDKTSIKFKLPMTWKDEYKGSLFYRFIIKPNPFEANDRNNEDWRQAYQNVTEVTGYFTDLKSATNYHIASLFRVCDQYGEICYYLQSKWQKVETTCNPAQFVLRLEEDSLLIDLFDPEFLYQQSYACPTTDWYHLTVRCVDTKNVVLDIIVHKFPYKVYQLSFYTLYAVIITHNNEKLFSKNIRTLEGSPSSVLNLKVMDKSDTSIILSWRAPKYPNGMIEKYEVTLQISKYFGCKDFTLSLINDKVTHWTNNTMITIQSLHPYVLYKAYIVAHNARYGSSSSMISFKTNKSDIATEVFSQLNAHGWNLTWGQPNDCTTITGPLYAKIKIRNINDNSENFPIVKQTQFTFLLLNKAMLFGGEKYVARVYVIRKANAPENSSAYQEIEFTTPPGVPPQVINLDVYEIDNRQLPDIAYLRWQSPIPPLNGTLRGYHIRLCSFRYKCRDTEISLQNICNLWDDYICGTASLEINTERIEVVAFNMDVVQSGPASVIYISHKIFNNPSPEEPGNFTNKALKRGIVDLEWHHPWKTGRPLDYFYIVICQLSTNLIRLCGEDAPSQNLFVNITNYKRQYTKRLYLCPSTRYSISIKAVTIAGQSSKVIHDEFETPPSLEFNGALEYAVRDSMISLHIPSVVNVTKNSIMHVIVKGSLGPEGCPGYLRVPEDLLALANLDVSDVAWEAAEILDAVKLFTIGNNKMYGRAKNCQLQPKQLYDITVIIVEGNQSSHIEPIALNITIFNGEVSRTYTEIWLIPLLLILAAVVVFYFYRRRKDKTIKKLIMQDEINLSQNIETYEHETKSAISGSKEKLSIPPDREDRHSSSLSWTTTPQVSLTAIKNTDLKEISFPVKVKDFEDYVREAIQIGLLIKQYEIFPRGQTRPWDYGKLPDNKTKNRYGNLIAYDETRVMLEKLPGEPCSDYINANYITGYKKQKHYIATQGPKRNTVVDFWRMIWQENVLIICMLANVIENGKTKCEQYWPDIGKRKKYGNIIVLNAKHNVYADYCFRTFQITCGKETRKVEHLHYTAWPDHGVPLYTHPVVTYLKKLLATPPGNGSVVVHCSAGVGRTGTIILCDICLRRAAAEGVVDVFAETASIRSERANMIDNKEQYLLAHLALMECLLSIPTTLPCNEMLTTRIKELKKQLSVQQQRLQNIAWQDEAFRQIISPPLSERNRVKNRFPELISDKVSRIYLKRYPMSDEDSDYLSGVYVDGVKLQKQYLATQLPMPSTINDFWRMIAEFKVELILMLQPPDPRDPTCCEIVPASGEFKPTPYLNITAKETVELEHYTSQKFLLVDDSKETSKEQSVTILCLKQWKAGGNQPPPPAITMVTLWQAAERIARGDGPTVTLCHDGVTGCGLYLALSFLLERMAVERECDVCLAVRAVRRSRPDFVRSLEHLEYLYDAAITYFDYFETYANFS